MTIPNASADKIEVEYLGSDYEKALDMGYITSTVDFATGIAIMVPRSQD